jgi:hypothetical protein
MKWEIFCLQSGIAVADRFHDRLGVHRRFNGVREAADIAAGMNVKAMSERIEARFGIRKVRA